MRVMSMGSTFLLAVLALRVDAVIAEEVMTANRQLVDEVVKARALQAQAITSVQGNCRLSMVDDYTRAFDNSVPEAVRNKMAPDGKLKKVLNKEITFGRMGEKHFDIERSTQNDVSLPKYHTAFDGTTGSVRQEGTKMISMGRSPETHRPGTPEPPSFLEPLPPAEVAAMLDRNELQLLSGSRTTLEGKAVLKFTFRTVKSAPGSRTEIWYAPDEGYLPILTRHYDPEGHLQTEVTDVKVGHFTVMGNEVCYPVSITQKAFHNGRQYRTAILSVDRQRLVFNANIPDSQFTIVANPDEWVWDHDLQMAVLDRGKQIDLNQILSTPLATGQQAASPQVGTPGRELASGTSRGVASTIPPVSEHKNHGSLVLAMLALIALGAGIILAWKTWGPSQKRAKPTE